MKVSLNTVKSLINFDLPSVDELVVRINVQLGGVEEVIDLGAKYKDAVIVKVVECENHPNADRLSVCQIDAGKSELIQVVCGAPNVKKDMLAVWLPPESIVPSMFDDKEPFKLDVRELRGVMSSGMLASAKELALGDDHDGILEIEPKAISKKDGFVVPGDNFAATFGLDDTIIDIENKMFTHRPDCFGQYGVAREIAGIFGQPFESPKGYIPTPTFLEGEGLALKIFNDIPLAVPRFMAVALDNITVGQSPLWLQCELICLGGKPINNIVDATNYVMLMYLLQSTNIAYLIL
jgi:phenylalanyl-tRNA synthetase beta chain